MRVGGVRRSWVALACGSAAAIVLAVLVGAAPAQAGGKERTTAYPQSSTPAAVTLKNDIGAIDVRRGSPAGLVVKEEWAYKEPTVTVHRDGGTLTAEATCPSNAALNNCSVTFTLTVPDPFALDATMSLGDVVVNGVSGTEQLKSGLGDVHVTGVTADRLTVDGDSGGIDLKDLHVGAVTANSSNGDIDVDAASVPSAIDATGDNGSVTVSVPAGVYAVTTHKDNGRAEVQGLQVDPNAPRHITASTSNGDVLVRARDGSGAPPPTTHRSSNSHEGGATTTTAATAGAGARTDGAGPSAGDQGGGSNASPPGSDADSPSGRLAASGRSAHSSSGAPLAVALLAVLVWAAVAAPVGLAAAARNRRTR